MAYDPERMSCKQAATYCGVSEKHLYRMRERMVGPPYLKLSLRVIFYRKSDLDTWIRQCRVSTLDYPGEDFPRP